MIKRILVAVDDSKNAGRAVTFLAENFVRDLKITLFSVCPDTATLCEMDSPGLIPYFKSRQSDFCVLEDEKKKLVQQALEGAKKELLARGFSEENIEIKLVAKQKGIARDIVAESQSGYDLIIMGRRGISAVKELFLGSITQKVIQMVKDISVLIVN